LAHDLQPTKTPPMHQASTKMNYAEFGEVAFFSMRGIDQPKLEIGPFIFTKRRAL